MLLQRSATRLSKRKHPRPSGLLGSSTLVLLMLLAEPAIAQNVIAYPERGQSPELQQRDRYDCYNWAVQQTGYDPQAQPLYGSTAPPPVSGGLFQGGFRGAALGAVGGAIGGNAGEGAAIGAAVGGLFGGLRRREIEMQQMQAEQQAAYARDRRTADFTRAETACLRGRGYSVD